MSDKMREEFSAWYLAEATQSYGETVRSQAEKNLAWVHPDGSFADPMLRLACLAWQAGRELLATEDAKDADRYRWLSEKFGVTNLPCAVERILGGDVYVADGKASIDAAIDAAMNKEVTP